MQKNRKFYFIISLLLMMGTTTIGWICYEAIERRRAQGFTLSRIAPDCSYELEFDVPQTMYDQETIRSILNQQFTYLGKGRQAFAFLSTDQKYVLKLFKMQGFHLRTNKASSAWKKIFPQKWKQMVLKDEKRIQNRKQLLNGYKIAHQIIPQDTAVFFTHLTVSQHLNTPICLKDAADKMHHIEADQYLFVVQPYCENVEDTFKKLIAHHKTDQAKRKIDQLLDLLENLAISGCEEHPSDYIFRDNIRFYKNRAVFIDVGSLQCIGKPQGILSFQMHLDRLAPFEAWLHKRNQELHTYYLCEKKSRLEKYQQFLEDRSGPKNESL